LLDDSYGALMRRLTTQYGRRAFTFTNWLYFTELPQVVNDSNVPVSQRYFLRPDVNFISWKTVTPMSDCIVAHTHLCTSQYSGTLERFRVPENISVMHHSTFCWNHRLDSECKLWLNVTTAVRDESLLKYRNRIMQGVNAVRSALFLR
jgi:hypothetical protein